MILAGLMLVALANDLVLLFVGLELVSIPTYVLLFLGSGSKTLDRTVAWAGRNSQALTRLVRRAGVD